MAILKDVAELNGLTMKQLSELSGIKYTTLVSTSKKDITSWTPEIKIKVSETLKMNVRSFESIMHGDVLSPFIKWVGGKRQLLPQLIDSLPPKYNTYFEPFIGGGALLLRLAPSHAVINDFNDELTNTYIQIRDNLEQVVTLLKQHQSNDSKDYYLDIRSADRDERFIKMSGAQRAARFIYLNKAGYNGLWRVNSKGQNNVPYGSHKKLNLISKSLNADSQYLKNNDVTIKTGDYRDAVKQAKSGDLVYFDPPYIPLNPTSSFTTYTRDGFGMIQQKQLRDLALELSKKNVQVMLSNSDTALTRDLYKDSVFRIKEVQAMRYVNSKANGRGKVSELIITNY